MLCTKIKLFFVLIALSFVSFLNFSFNLVAFSSKTIKITNKSRNLLAEQILEISDLIYNNVSQVEHHAMAKNTEKQVKVLSVEKPFEFRNSNFDQLPALSYLLDDNNMVRMIGGGDIYSKRTPIKEEDLIQAEINLLDSYSFILILERFEESKCILQKIAGIENYTVIDQDAKHKAEVQNNKKHLKSYADKSIKEYINEGRTILEKLAKFDKILSDFGNLLLDLDLELYPECQEVKVDYLNSRSVKLDYGLNLQINELRERRAILHKKTQSILQNNNHFKLFFTHIQRSGGSSMEDQVLKRWLKNESTMNCRENYHTRFNDMDSNMKLEFAKIVRENMTFQWRHCPYGLHTFLESPETTIINKMNSNEIEEQQQQKYPYLYMTMLRNETERLISWWKFCRSESPSGCGTWNQYSRSQISLKDFYSRRQEKLKREYPLDKWIKNPKKSLVHWLPPPVRFYDNLLPPPPDKVKKQQEANMVKKKLEKSKNGGMLKKKSKETKEKQISMSSMEQSKSKLLPKPPKDQTRKNTEQQRTSQPRNNNNNSSSNSSSLSSSNIITSENLSVGRSGIDKEESKFNNNSNESLGGHTNAKYIEKGTVAFELYSSLTPFLLVDLVFPNSPASSAGLLVNDKVVKFGHIEDNMINSRDRALPTVGQFVQGNQGVPITVIVRREMKAEENRNTSSSSTRESENYQLVELILTPQTWEGRGLLGCHIINV